MSNRIREIAEEIEVMKEKLLEEIAKQEEHINYEIHDGYVRFEKEILAKQKENMKGLVAYFRDVPKLHLLTAPIVYAMIIPAIIFDMLLFVYQQTAFRIYKFERVKRGDYIVFDRHHLAYLNIFEKINCLYCSYFNGLMQYAAEIASKTELYFCPIKHAKKIAYHHKYLERFLPYGEPERFRDKWQEIRDDMQGKPRASSL